MAIRRGKKLVILTGALLAAVLIVAGRLSWNYHRFWHLFERLNKNEKGYREYLHRQTGIVFVHVPGGTFTMGTADDDYGDKPAHEVTLDDFLIAKYEVDQENWRAVLNDSIPEPSTESLPVVGISWEEAKEFCERTRLALPSEAQWEFAAKGGQPDISQSLDDSAWHQDNSGRSLHPIGRKSPNGRGIHDMLGNAKEWCLDYYDRDFYRSGVRRNPVCDLAVRIRSPLLHGGEGEVAFVSTRGGSYDTRTKFCDAVTREGIHGRPPPDVGFRPVFFPMS